MDLAAITIVYALSGIVFGSFSAYIASEKNRDVQSWVILGFLFGFVGMLAIIGVPSRTTTEKIEKANSRNKEVLDINLK